MFMIHAEEKPTSRNDVIQSAEIRGDLPKVDAAELDRIEVSV